MRPRACIATRAQAGHPRSAKSTPLSSTAIQAYILTARYQSGHNTRCAQADVREHVQAQANKPARRRKSRTASQQLRSAAPCSHCDHCDHWDHWDHWDQVYPLRLSPQRPACVIPPPFLSSRQRASVSCHPPPPPSQNYSSRWPDA